VRGGGVVVEDVPAPLGSPRSLLVRVAYSCVSVGTEMSNVALSGLPLYRRALRQHQHVKRALELARDQGLKRTYDQVRGQLAAGLPTGYSAAGTVVGVGEEVCGFTVGDRVACAGAGIANHAELIDVPVNLVVKVPEGLPLDAASTVTLGAIALQGIRRAEPTLGETIGVIGLGVLGQLTAQVLRANGCRVIGADLDRTRVARALECGMTHGVVTGSEDFVARAVALTDGYGADAVIVTAATPSHQVISQAMRACRKKGRVVLVGDVGLNLKRTDMYENELDLLMSTSSGPGRYDAVYEEEGRDYPRAYVRWTENRNMDTYLQLLASGAISLDRLDRRTYPIDAAEEAYEALKDGGEKPLVVLLEYPQAHAQIERRVVLREVGRRTGRIRTALVGAGSFAGGTHIPNILKLRDRFELRCVMSRTGMNAKTVAMRSSAGYATTDYREVLEDRAVDLVLIATRHHLHADYVLRALEAGKHVFVEKPLAVTADELERIERFYAKRDSPLLMTGFNRRFSPAIRRARELLGERSTPLMVDYRMNVGYLPPEHWVHGREGGGRNIGEACHVYDLFDYLTDAEVIGVRANAIRPGAKHWSRNDNFVAVVSYADGSICVLTYTALGHSAHPKERMDVFAAGNVLSLDDYKVLSVAGIKHRGWRSRTADKGHLEELEVLGRCLLEGGTWPISLDEQLRAMQIAFAVEDQLWQ
jgi:predicted dehydrogenase/threonine dehydrogenase-like Zn-dependent dehydrogenase